MRPGRALPKTLSIGSRISETVLGSRGVCVETERLRLIPCSLAFVDAYVREPAEGEALIAARIPADWPGPELDDFLPLYRELLAADAAQFGYGPWLVIARPEGTVIGSVGFKGTPNAEGTIEIGYSTLPSFRRRGYAFEAARALVEWAFAQPGVKRVVAECDVDNVPSIRVLEKVGMHRLEQKGRMLQWECTPYAQTA